MSKTLSTEAQSILAVHNKHRAAVNVPPLEWSDTLTEQARVWAQHLVDTGKFEHAQERHNAGENLACGTGKSLEVAQLVEVWAAEQKDFKSGTFPEVSKTGNWADVGHYTQMVWRNTKSVGGVMITRKNGEKVLVCRYSPAGNWSGERVY